MNLPALPMLVGCVLALACVLALVRLWRQRQQRTHLQLAILMLLQPALAALLYFGLFPPMQATQPGNRLIVLTAGWRSASPSHATGHRIALPEAEPSASDERTPDLATALRRHPQVTSLHVLGHGLEARDRDAARGYHIDFNAAPLPAGVVALQFPARVAAGNAIPVSGTVQGVAIGTVELLDPAGQRVQRGSLASDGRFALRTTAREAGLVTYTLRVLDATGALKETVPIPTEVVAATQMHLLVLAGAPNPELKYLRRWAKDAGISLHTQIAIGGGSVMGDAPVTLALESLQKIDAVLLDTRSLQALRVAEVQALTSAIRKGLGVLLQLDAPPSPDLRARLRTWGFELATGEATQSIALASDLPTLSSYRVTDLADGSTSLLSDMHARPVGLWRAVGLGRVGLLPLPETYPLVLQGNHERHAQLWSQVMTTLARSAETALPAAPPAPTWVGAGIALCRPAVAPANAAQRPALPDSNTESHQCAAAWPQRAGWHRLPLGQLELAYYVLPSTTAPAWRLGLRQQATRLLASQATPPASRTASAILQPGRAWPWLLAWCVLAVLAWLCERRWYKSVQATGLPR